MASGWQALGDVLGGGIDTAGAYETGRLRTAQTEGALAAAREHQLKSMSLEFQAKNQLGMESALIAAGRDPKEAHLIATVANGGLGADFNSTVQGLGHQQENDFRATLGDPKAPLADQFAAGQGVQGKVLNPYDQVTPQTYVDLRAPGAAGAPAPLQVTPIGSASIRADDALAYQRMHPQPAAGDAPGGVKIPTNYMANPNYNPADPSSPMVVPIVGGPADPNVGPAMGTRERQVIARVMDAGKNTANDLEVWKNMQSGASQGTFGIGSNPGTKIMDAGMSSLKLRLAPSEIRQYNNTISGFSMQMQTLERMGMQGSQGQAAQFDNLLFRDGDTVEDKMFKMARIRQVVENALTTISALNPNMPDDAKATIQATLSTVSQSVPYTPNDVIALTDAQRTNPGLTLAQMVQQRKMNAPVGAKPPAPAAPPSPGAPAVGLDQDGWMDMGGGVRVRLKPGQ